MIADSGTLVNNGALYKKLAYDPVGDFAPISLLGRFQFLVVTNAATGIRDFAEMKQRVAASPDKFNYGSAGAGSPFHVGMEVIKQETGMSMLHVPYKGMAPVIQALLSNEVQFGIADVVTALPHIKTGKLVALAAVTDKRIESLSAVPTLRELGLSNVQGWQALVVPANTPEDVKDRLGSAMKAVMESPVSTQLFREKGVDVALSTPAELRAFQMSQIDRWHKFIRDRGISLD